MSILDQLPTSVGRKDDKLNIEIAKKLSISDDFKSIEELVQNLSNKDSNIASDCIKILYEIGYIKPELIAKYVDIFLNLTGSKNNRLVWGAMIALQTITLLTPKEIWQKKDTIVNQYENGSVITKDNAIKILAKLSSINIEYADFIFPKLVGYLEEVRPQSFPMYAESVFIAINTNNKSQFSEVLMKRINELNDSKKERITKILKKLEKF